MKKVCKLHTFFIMMTTVRNRELLAGAARCLPTRREVSGESSVRREGRETDGWKSDSGKKGMRASRMAAAE